MLVKVRHTCLNAILVVALAGALPVARHTFAQPLPSPVTNPEVDPMFDLKVQITEIYDRYLVKWADALADLHSVEALRYYQELEMKKIDALAAPLSLNTNYQEWYAKSVRRDLEVSRPDRFAKADLDHARADESRLLKMLGETTRPGLEARSRTEDEMRSLLAELEEFTWETEQDLREQLAGISRFFVPLDFVPSFVNEFAQSTYGRAGFPERIPITAEETLSWAYVAYMDFKICSARASILENYHRDLMDIRYGPGYAYMKETADFDAREAVRDYFRKKFNLNGQYVNRPIHDEFWGAFLGQAEAFLGHRNFPMSFSMANLPRESYLAVDGLECLRESKVCSEKAVRSRSSSTDAKVSE